MQITASREAAKSAIDELGLADYDEEFDLYQALLKDEMFCAVAYLYDEAMVYRGHADERQADADARAALKRAVREHSQRVRQEADE